MNKAIIVYGIPCETIDSIARILPSFYYQIVGAPPTNRSPFNDQQLHRINDSLLDHLSSNRNIRSELLTDPFNDPLLIDLKTKASNLALDILKLHKGTWFINDPRTCHMLPFWDDVLTSIGCDIHFIILSCHPLKATECLRDKYSFPSEQIISSWIKYATLSLIEAEDKKSIFLDTESLFTSPSDQLYNALNFFDIPLPTNNTFNYNYINKNFISKIFPCANQNSAKGSLGINSQLIKDAETIYNLLSDLPNHSTAINKPELKSIIKKILSQATNCSPLPRLMRQDHGNELKYKNEFRHPQTTACRQNLTSTVSFTVNCLEIIKKLLRKISLIRRLFSYYHKLQSTTPLCGPNLNQPPPTTSSQLDSDSKLNPIPSPPKERDFDKEFYLTAYPDVQGLDPYTHYIQYGQKEGRLSHCPTLFTREDLQRLNFSKETVLIVSHQASRTGAPILTLNIARELKKKYNTICLLLTGGNLLPFFIKECDIVLQTFPQSNNPNVVSAVLNKLFNTTTIKFAIVNSIGSKAVLPALAYHFIPSLLLVHEFASINNPNSPIRDALLWSGPPVYSAQIVFENNTAQCPEILENPMPILPQGKCLIPRETENNLQENSSLLDHINKTLRPKPYPENTVIIIGAGTVQLRKGVDLFLSCASKVVASKPKNSFRFVWIGKGYEPEKNHEYSVFLQDYILKTNINDYICFIDETEDINAYFKLADIMLLSSRLDPLPNVAIDAMVESLPVICFDKTTGIADFLKDNDLGKSCVVPYLDTDFAARNIEFLINNPDERKKIGNKIQQLGNDKFNISRYVEKLDQLAITRVKSIQTERAECKIIEKHHGISLDYYSTPNRSSFSYSKTVRFFVRSWKTGLYLRKPFPGFHPGVYSEFNNLKPWEVNPLSHFLESGSPTGPWLPELIRPSDMPDSESKILSAALHIHVYFIDLLPDIISRLKPCRLQLDLLVSISKLEDKKQTESILKEYTGGDVEIRVVPNRGRDIGPLLSEFNQLILDRYKIIGHVHTKKSIDLTDSSLGKRWFAFLLENLLGQDFSMGSTILHKISHDKNLGLVFPDDPNICGWTKNKKFAEELAPQLGIDDLPRIFFDFPVGTMFWAKTEALKPLLSKGFSWNNYPEEPLPYDGTILHAIERLIPSIVETNGFRKALTYTPGVTR